MRSSLAHAAWTVEDRVVWGAADALRGLVDTVRWPFERIALAVEHGLVWPIQEETALWSRSARAAAMAAAIVLAGAAVAAGIIVSQPSGGGGGATAEATGPASAPSGAAIIPKNASKAAAATGPVLHGSTPDLAPESGGGVSKARAAAEAPATSGAVEADAAAAAAGVAGVAAQSAGAEPGSQDTEVAGPGAIKVARKFSGAFVLYETGRVDQGVRGVFHRTATADLSRALLKRQPRLPANVKVPKAKVLNVVAGPKQGDTYVLSVSLLRVGVTSELRLFMSKGKRSGWKVTDVRG